MLLLFLLCVKHFFADYVWQTNSMVTGKRQRVDWFGWLMAHAGVHGVLTFVVLLLFVTPLWAACLGLFDCIVHATVDRLKCHPDLGGRYTPDQQIFWVLMGLDQLLHVATYFVIVLYLV
jgi:hypothetical protein